MLNFSVNLSLLFTEVELIDRFKAAKDCGFDAVEIQFPYELPAKIIRQALDEHQLELVLFNVDADDLLQGGEGLAAVPEKQAQFRQAIEQAVAYAKILKPKAINILAGCCLESTKKALYLETFKNNLRYALEAFSPLAIKTVFEAINSYDMPRFIVDNSLQMLEIQREINHPDLLMQYDIYHMQRMGENCAEIIVNHANNMGVRQVKWLKAGILDKGQVYLCRYADDFVCAFEYEKDAQRFYKALKLRLNKFCLEVAEDKTNIMVFSCLKIRAKTCFKNFLGFDNVGD